MAIAHVVCALVISVVGLFAYDEAKAWLPHLTRRIMEIAVHRLPNACRARYEEEWQCHIDEIPGRISKLFFSMSLLRAASGICRISGARGMHRFFEVLIATGILALTAPLFIVISILIKLESPGPIFVRYTCIPTNGRPFWKLGFRTLNRHPAWPELFYSVTRVGSFLQWSGMFELPGFINVLKGDRRLFDSPDR